MMHSRKINEVMGRKQYLAEMSIPIALLATLCFSACAVRELTPEEQQLKLQRPAIQMNAGNQMMMQTGAKYLSPPRNPFPYYPYAPPFSQPLGDD